MPSKKVKQFLIMVAAKGMTILKCSKIDKKIIDYFVDDSPAKQGLYSAGDHIPIISRKNAEKNYQIILLFLLQILQMLFYLKKNLLKWRKIYIPKDDVLIM